VVDECVVDLDELSLPALSARKPSSVPLPQVETEGQADLVGFRAGRFRLAGAVAVERLQLLCEELDGVDDRLVAGVEASVALETGSTGRCPSSQPVSSCGYS